MKGIAEVNHKTYIHKPEKVYNYEYTIVKKLMF